MRPGPSPLAIWAGMITLYVVWGTTYLGIAVVIETIPPYVMVAIRFLVAGLLLAAIAFVRERGAVARPSRRQLVDSLIVGTGLVAVGNALVGVGEQTVPSGIAAVLVALMPAWLAVFGRALLGERLPRPVLAGIAIGIVGVGILAWPTGGAGSLDPFGLAAIIIAPIGWSLGSLYSARRASLPNPPLLATAYQMIGGGLVAAVVALASGEAATFDPSAVSGRSLIAFAYLSVVGSLVGYTTYAWLIHHAPLSRVSTYTYVNPVVAVILGALFLAEPITPRTVVAAAVIVVAVALIVSARGRLPAPQPAATTARTGRAGPIEATSSAAVEGVTPPRAPSPTRAGRAASS